MQSPKTLMRRPLQVMTEKKFDVQDVHHRTPSIMGGCTSQNALPARVLAIRTGRTPSLACARARDPLAKKYKKFAGMVYVLYQLSNPVFMAVTPRSGDRVRASAMVYEPLLLKKEVY